MNCKEVQELIPAYLDGETSPSEKRLIQAHLMTCMNCQEELEVVDGLRNGLQQHFRTKAVAVAPSVAAWSNLQKGLPAKRRAGGRLGGSFAFPGQLSGLRLSTQRIGVILLIVFMLVFVAPPVWARLEPILINWFSFSSPDGDGFSAIGGFDPFTPFHAAYVPEDFDSGLLGTMTGQGIESIEIGYDNRDGGFITLVQSMGPSVSELPPGESARVGIDIAVFIPAFATSSQELQAARPEVSIVTNHDYAETNYLAWFLGEIKVEMFSNLSLEEMLRVAESLEPMQASEGELPQP
jgi:anti-sigma factor RsiW